VPVWYAIFVWWAVSSSESEEEYAQSCAKEAPGVMFLLGFFSYLGICLMVVLLILFLLTGCSSMGEWLSGSAGYRSPEFVYPVQLDHITLGVTSQAKVRAVFGAPTDLQTAVLNGISRETWAYAKASPSINPLQYLPVVGVFALPLREEAAAFSVSFSSDGIVDGISVRDFQPYGDVTSAADRFKSARAVSPYGTNNPMVHAAQH